MYTAARYFPQLRGTTCIPGSQPPHTEVGRSAAAEAKATECVTDTHIHLFEVSRQNTCTYVFIRTYNYVYLEITVDLCEN